MAVSEVAAPVAEAPAAPAPAPEKIEKAAPPSSKGTVFEDTEGGEEATVTTPGDWPAGWRELYAGGDAKLLKQMERYSSPKAALDSLIALKQKVSKGEITKALGDNPTAEEVKDWRAANGVPETYDGYKLELGEGRVVGEHDKPLMEKFLQNMHEKNAKPDSVNAAVKAYYEIQDEAIRQCEESDVRSRQEAEDALRVEWGQEYRRSINMVNDMFASAPEGVKDSILTARLADGSALANNADVVRFLVQLAREVNPVATLVPGAQGNVTSAIADEITSIERSLRDDPPGSRDRYFKDQKMQTRYAELLDAQERIKKRA